jgi:hypothetical protein
MAMTPGKVSRLKEMQQQQPKPKWSRKKKASEERTPGPDARRAVFVGCRDAEAHRRRHRPDLPREPGEPDRAALWEKELMLLLAALIGLAAVTGLRWTGRKTKQMPKHIARKP